MTMNFLKTFTQGLVSPSRERSTQHGLLAIALSVLAGGAIAAEAAATPMAAQAVAPDLLEACNAAQYQTVLHPMAMPKPLAPTDKTPITAPSVQAVWLTGQLLQWPAAEVGGRYRHE